MIDGSILRDCMQGKGSSFDYQGVEEWERICPDSILFDCKKIQITGRSLRRSLLSEDTLKS